MTKRTFTLDEFIDQLLFSADGWEPEHLTRENWLHIAVEAAMSLGIGDCVLCGVNTYQIGEYYMVRKRLWDKYGAGDEMLCVGCLERQMGRKLKAADFIRCEVNTAMGQSMRLQDRLNAV